MVKKIRSLIAKGEGINIEFKESKSELNKDLFESVCAFLNRFGGEILLGVKDNGEIVGVDEDKLKKLKMDFVTSVNNANKINPTYYLDILDFEVDGKIVLYIAVPESSQVHRCNGKIFDRNEDGDFDITNHTNQVAALYQRKQTTHFENDIFQFLKMDDLSRDLIALARKRASLRNSEHPWVTMSDDELLKSAGLYSYDYKKNVEGYNLACILIFGKDETIHSVLPYHRVDAILRKNNLDRYDDRDDIRTNLIETYDRLMAFVTKHLPDPFYLEGDVSISLRDKIFREVISNILIHRDYSNPFPTKLIIGNDTVFTENANKPHGLGPIDPNNFSPFPKNPTIAKVFKEIGYVDELGSGVRNIHKYSRAYFGGESELNESDIFKIIFQTQSTTPQVTLQVTPQVTLQVTPQVELSEKAISILEFCKVPRTRTEIQEFIGISDREHFRTSILAPLLESGLILMTIPDKPKSSKQKYVRSNHQ